MQQKKAYVRNSEEYTRVSEFVDEKAVSSKTIAYRESESEYLRKLNDLMGWTIYKDNILYSNFNVSIKRNVANASIVEDYKYYIDDDFGDESFRRREYRFEMERILVIRSIILKFTSTFKIGLTHAKQGDECCHDSTGIYLFS